MWNEQIVVTCGVLHANEVKYMFTVFVKESIRYNLWRASRKTIAQRQIMHNPSAMCVMKINARAVIILL
jgi:hypothetical protein